MMNESYLSQPFNNCRRDSVTKTMLIQIDRPILVLKIHFIIHSLAH